MGGRRRYQGAGGRRGTQFYTPDKEIIDLFRPKKTTAVWRLAVPLWEREYCKQAVALPWEEFCEVKQRMILYPEVEKWNDSAAEEAFHVAKRRYFATINGTPCDLPEPDPDAYIDVVQWDSPDSGDIDWPEALDLDAENEENCSNRSQDTGKMPHSDQQMQASEKERYEMEKSQWKKRPFGYGHVYFPEIHEVRTIICEVVDLYTADPCLTNYWKPLLWQKGSSSGEKNSAIDPLFSNNYENTDGVNIMRTGWSEDELEVKNNPKDPVIEQRNGTVTNTVSGSSEGTFQKHPFVTPLVCNNNEKKDWGNTLEIGSNENEMEVKNYPKDRFMEQKNGNVTYGAWNEVVDFEHEKENKWTGNWQQNFPQDEKNLCASTAITYAATINSGSCRYQDENGWTLVGKNHKTKGYPVSNYGLEHLQRQNQSFPQTYWKPISKDAPKRPNVPARRNNSFQVNNTSNVGNSSFYPNHYSSACNQGYFKECYPAPNGDNLQMHNMKYRGNSGCDERWTQQDYTDQ